MGCALPTSLTSAGETTIYIIRQKAEKAFLPAQPDRLL
jgi:hypothetical protein